MDDDYKSTDEEKVDTSDDVSTDESSNIAPLWSLLFTTDTELDISLYLWKQIVKMQTSLH